MLSVNLTKPELTFDAVRKSYKDLKPTDVALVSTALIEAGRFAVATHDGQDCEWDKTVAEEEPVTLTVHLKPSHAAADKVLADREDLKTLVSTILHDGVEYLFSPTDIGWHWTLERVNWSTISGGELKRRVKFRPQFEDGSLGVELGPGGKRKAVKKSG